MTVLLLEFASTWCNSWPSLEILHNQRPIFSGIIKEKLLLDVALSPSAHNVIELTGIGKQQGANNVWDTRIDDTGRIIEDKTLAIQRVELNGIDMGQPWIHSLAAPDFSYGVWYGNSTVRFEFTEPVMNWIIASKFVNNTNTDSIKYNNYNSKFNYEVLKQRIQHIRQQINDQDSSL
jgi:hypothetical protein